MEERMDQTCVWEVWDQEDGVISTWDTKEKAMEEVSKNYIEDYTKYTITEDDDMVVYHFGKGYKVIVSKSTRQIKDRENMKLSDYWTKIKSVYDLPTDEHYCGVSEGNITWEEIFEDDIDEDETYCSADALFMLIDRDKRCFPAIGSIEFFKKDADLSEDPGADANYWFVGAAIAPGDHLGDNGSYLTGIIYAKPIAWMPIDYSPENWS